MDIVPKTEVAPEASFPEEFARYWARVPEKGFFLCLLAAWCVLFEFWGISSFNFDTTRPSLFLWMYHAWNMPSMDSSQGNLIPPVVAVLLWVKRKELAASMAGPWWPGLILTGLALVIGTVVTVANGHDGTPAVTVLVSQPGRDTSALPLSAPEGPCALVSTALPGRGAVTVSGACSGTVSGSAVCGDATGSVKTCAVPERAFCSSARF